jgi:sulfopyruvate decarboxylase subunit alpha
VSDGQPEVIGELLHQALSKAGIDFVAAVPEYFFVGLLDRLENDERVRVVDVCREEEGVGVCTGAYLAGRQPALVMQNAGLFNSCNALITTAMQFEIPILLVVWYAGYFGDKAFMRLGESTEDVMKALGIRFRVLDEPATVDRDVAEAWQLAVHARRPVGVLATTALAGVRHAAH